MVKFRTSLKGGKLYNKLTLLMWAFWWKVSLGQKRSPEVKNPKKSSNFKLWLNMINYISKWRSWRPISEESRREVNRSHLRSQKSRGPVSFINISLASRFARGGRWRFKFLYVVFKTQNLSFLTLFRDYWPLVTFYDPETNFFESISSRAF